MSAIEHDASSPEREKRLEVTLIWGGTGESKKARVSDDDTAGQVFELIYERFHQQKTDQDSFEVNGSEFPRASFGETVESLTRQLGEHLEFEVIPPTSGA